MVNRDWSMKPDPMPADSNVCPPEDAAPSAKVPNAKVPSAKAPSAKAPSEKVPTPGAEQAGDGKSNTASGIPASQPLEAVWRQFGSQLRRRARTRLRQYGLTGQAESMDICNDVMADLARSYGSESVSPDDVKAYIMRAIDNQVLDTFRTLARQCRDFRRNELTPVDDMTVANRETTPSQIAIRREVVARIRTMLTAEDARAVDMMLENRDWNEIGEALGLRADTARMRVRRALDRVRRDIGLGKEDQQDE